MTLESETLTDLIEALDEVGTTATFRTNTETYDPATLEVTESGVTEVVAKSSPVLKEESKIIGPNGLRTVHTFILIPGNQSVVPAPGMDVTINTTEYVVQTVEQHSIGTTVIAYVVYLC